MSKLIGEQLPDELLAALDGENLREKVGPVYLLVTADEDGTPRPCMLSAGEVLAVDGRRLRFALWPGSRTSANLGRGGRALFCHVAPATTLYVRGSTQRLEAAAPTSLECFELAVDSVETDGHAGMPVTSGISFALERGDPGELAEAWRRQLEPLRG